MERMKKWVVEDNVEKRRMRWRGRRRGLPKTKWRMRR